MKSTTLLLALLVACLGGCYSRSLTHSNGIGSTNGWSINLIASLIVLGVAYGTVQNNPGSKKLKMFWGAWAGGFLGALPFVLTGSSGANPGLETMVGIVGLLGGVAAGAVLHDGELKLP
jgi:peptidoglycan/LPS O-acetylase OafA/YrhL